MGGNTAHQELLSSLKQLYVDHEYSDLTIASRSKTYHVHKAIVCPRSKYFATECRKTPPAEAKQTTGAALNLGSDDPQAVDMVIQYLYHLDYPIGPLDEAILVNGYHNGETNGHNHEEASVQDTTSEGKAPEPVESPLDEFLPINVQKSKNKKKRKKKTGAEAPEATAEAGTEEPLPEKWDEAVAAEEAAKQRKQSQQEPPPQEPEEPTAPPPSMMLAVHAKVYELSKRYGVEGLETLALEKFEREAPHQWATEDFLQAAKEVYSAAATDQGKDDRRMKDMVTEIVCQHPELLDKAETQKVIRGLDLGYDVLMRVHRQGGFR